MDAVLIERRAPVAIVTLNRPDRLNAGEQTLLDGLSRALSELRREDGIRAVVLTGAGRAFCAGADLTAMTWAPEYLSFGEQVQWVLDHGWNPVIRELFNYPKPIVAAVNGVAAGGGVGLALACDLTIAAESAFFKQVFTHQLAVIPDVGSTWHLPHLVGRQRARGLTLLGDDLTAATAKDWGMIWDAVPDDDLMDHALAVASRLAALPSNTVRAVKHVLDAAPFATFAEQTAREGEVQRNLAAHPNFIEGVRAFNEKRDPSFE